MGPHFFFFALFLFLQSSLAFGAPPVLTKAKAETIARKAVMYGKFLFDKDILDVQVAGGVISISRKTGAGAMPANASYQIVPAAGGQPPKILIKECIATQIPQATWDQIFSSTGAVPNPGVSGNCEPYNSELAFISHDSVDNKFLVEARADYTENNKLNTATSRALLSLGVSAAAAPEIMCFQATDGGQYYSDSLTVVSGTQVKLRWAADNAANCIVSSLGENGISRNDVPIGGVSSAVSYTLTCTSPGGTTASKTINITPSNLTPWTWIKGSYWSSDPHVGLTGAALPATSRYIAPAAFGGAQRDTLGRWIGVMSKRILANWSDMLVFRFDGTDWTRLPLENRGMAASGSHWGTKGVASPTVKHPYLSFEAFWLDSNNHLWVFGGAGMSPAPPFNTIFFNALFKWDGTNWAWMWGPNAVNQPGNYGSLGVTAAGNIPPHRGSGAYWKDNAGNFWMFGGRASNNNFPEELYNDLWKFDGTNWTWIKGSNTQNATGTYGTLNVAAAANTPGARRSPAYWRDAAGNFWLYGGYGFTTDGSARRTLSDLWMFNGTNWIWKSGSSSVGEAPIPGTKGVTAPTNRIGRKQYAAGAADGLGNHWIFGGVGIDKNSVGCQGLNDLWKYDGTNWTFMGGDDLCPAAQVVNSKPVIQGQPTLESSPPGGFVMYPHMWVDSSNRVWVHNGGTWVFASKYTAPATAPLTNVRDFVPDGCFVTAAGAAHCWGRHYELGNGSTLDDNQTLHGFTKPMVTGMNANVTQLASANSERCALQSGAVKCWGTCATSPVAIPGLASGVTKISGGIAIQSGAVKTYTCTGSSAVAGLETGVTEISGQGPIASYSHACVIQNGGAKCWGGNSSGQVGDGTTADKAAPTPVQGLNSGVTKISVASYSTCAVHNGGVKCWGQINGSTTPQTIAGLESDVTDVFGGYQRYCAIRKGRLHCWGFGNPGTKDFVSFNTPATINPSSPFTPTGMECGVEKVKVATSSMTSRTCAVQFGKLYCWGIDGMEATYGTCCNFTNSNAVDGHNAIYAEPLLGP